MAYTIRIPVSSIPTLGWLADHGYDAEFCKLAKLDNECDVDGCAVYEMTEPDAWSFHNNVASDYDAFLSCCGDSRLSEILLDLYGRIV